MFEPQQQHSLDLQEHGGFGDPRSWLSGGDDAHSPSTHLQTKSALATAAAAGSAGGASENVDRTIYKELLGMVPLIQSLIDRRANSSFTRRGSVVYTKTPSRDSYSKKITEVKGKNAALSFAEKKRRDNGDKDQDKNAGNNQEGCCNSSVFSAKALESEELNLLKEQLGNLQGKLLEKEELLKLADITKSQMIDTQEKIDELKKELAAKDSLLKSTQMQLYDARINLADKQAALEKIQWEAQTSNKKVETLQEDLNSTRGEITFLMGLFDGFGGNESTAAEDLDLMPNHVDHLLGIDDMDEMEMQKMQEAGEAYIAAVALAKQKQDEESIAAAARARSRLQSFVSGSKGM